MKLLATTEFEFHSKNAASAETLRLGHLSDFHLGKSSGDDLPQMEALERWLGCFAEQGVDVLAVTGDLVDEPGDRDRLEEAKRLLDSAPFPHLVVPGNHDVPKPAEPGPFEEIFGHYPRVETKRDIEFVLFDSMKGLPVEERSQTERQEAASTGFFSRGKVGSAQRDEVEAQFVEPPRFGRVVLVHHHLRRNAPTQQGRRKNPTAPKGLMAPLDDADALLDWSADHGAHLILHGHKHDFWAPYEPRPGLVALNVGASTSVSKGRKRRGRLVDIAEGMAKVVVRDVELA